MWQKPKTALQVCPSVLFSPILFLRVGAGSPQPSCGCDVLRALYPFLTFEFPSGLVLEAPFSRLPATSTAVAELSPMPLHAGRRA